MEALACTMVLYSFLIKGGDIHAEEVNYVPVEKQTCMVMKDKCDDVAEPFGDAVRLTKIVCLCDNKAAVPVIRADKFKIKMR